MKVVACHHYLARRGPADLTFERDVGLLEQCGHVVIRLTLDKWDVGRRGRVGLVLDAVWNREFCSRLGDLVRRERPDIVHFHNTFPLISPAAYYAARSHGAAVVQTLDPFDVLSGSATLPKIRHACFRRPAAVARLIGAVLAVHRAIGTYRRAVDSYFAPTRAARDCCAKSGLLPVGRILVRTEDSSPRAALANLMRDYEQAIRRRAGIAGRTLTSNLGDRIDPMTARRRAVAERWRPDFAPTETWVPMASNLAIVRADAPSAFQSKVA